MTTEDTDRNDTAWRLAGSGNLIIAALLLTVAGLLVHGNLTMEVVGDGGLLGPQGFGWLVAALSTCTAIFLGITAIRGGRTHHRETTADPEGVNWVAVGSVLGGLVAFALLIDVLGWLVMATIMFAVVARGLGNRHLLRNVGVGLTMASIIQLVFGGALGLALPSGILGGW